MVHSEALTLFNEILKQNGEYTLLSDYTEEEFKKAWRFIAKKCHPDSKDGSTLYFQKLKDAKEILEKSICKKKIVVEPVQKENKPGDALQKIRENTIKKMNFFVSEIVSSEFQMYLKQLKKAIFYRIIKINQLTNEVEIKNEYTQFLNQVYTLYNEMKHDYFYDHFIIEESVHESIRYDCNIESFYYQLVNLKRFYSFQNSIDSILESYKKNENFDFLKYKVENLVDVCRKSLKCSLSKEIILNNLESGLKDLFKRYERIKTRLDVLKKQELDLIQNKEIELIEKNLYVENLDKVEEKLFLLEQKISYPFVKRDLYVKVNDVKEEEKGSIFLVINLKGKNCQLLEWRDCEDFRPVVQEVKQEFILSHFVLLESYFINENKVFKNWYGNDLLFTFGNFLLFMIDKQIGVDRKENYLSSQDLIPIHEEKYPVNDIKKAIVKKILFDVRKDKDQVKVSG